MFGSDTHGGKKVGMIDVLALYMYIYIYVYNMYYIIHCIGVTTSYGS